MTLDEFYFLLTDEGQQLLAELPPIMPESHLQIAAQLRRQVKPALAQAVLETGHDEVEPEAGGEIHAVVLDEIGVQEEFQACTVRLVSVIAIVAEEAVDAVGSVEHQFRHTALEIIDTTDTLLLRWRSRRGAFRLRTKR